MHKQTYLNNKYKPSRLHGRTNTDDYRQQTSWTTGANPDDDDEIVVLNESTVRIRTSYFTKTTSPSD